MKTCLNGLCPKLLTKSGLNGDYNCQGRDLGVLLLGHVQILGKIWYSKTCLKQPLKNRQNIDLMDKW